VVVAGLAVAAILYANRAERARGRMAQAERDAREKLWRSYRDQARGTLLGTQAGHRFESLEAIRRAAQMRPTLDLRNEAIASLARADLRIVGALPQPGCAAICLDSSFERCAVADEQGRIRVQTLAGSQTLLDLPASTNAVQIIFPFSPDGHFLPVKYADGVTRLWDLQTRKVAQTFQVWWPIETIDFTADSRLIVTAQEDGLISLQDLTTLAVPRKIKMGFTRPFVRFSPNGKELGVFSPRANEVLILDTSNGEVVNRLAHSAVVRGLSWHPTEDIVATACGDNNGYLWKLTEPQRPLRVLAGHQSSLMEIDFHRNGEWLISNSWDGTVRLWDTTTGQELARLAPGGLGMRLSEDGRWLAWYTNVNPSVVPNSLVLLEVTPRRALRFLREPDPEVGNGDPRVLKTSAIWEANFSPDERLLVSTGKQGVRIWDLERGREIAHLTRYEAHSAFFHPDGQHLIASCDEGLLRWRVERAGAGEFHFSDPERLADHEPCERATMSDSGALLAYGHAGRVHVQGKEKSFPGWPGIHFVAVSHNGAWIAASAWGYDGVRLWDTTNGTLAGEFPSLGAADLAFSPDDRWLMTGGAGEYCFWDPATRRLMRRLPRNDMPTFHGTLAFSQDGQLLAVVRSITKVQLLDAQTLEELAMLESPVPQFVSRLAFSPSGNQLAVATETPFIQVWDLHWLRQELGKLGLDWGTNSGSIPILTAQSTNVEPGSASFHVLASGAVALAGCLAFFVLRRQKRLVAGYLRINELALQRARDLEVAQRELLHSEKMKALGTLAAGIAHDFNNLLSVIRLSNDVIGRDAPNKPDVREEVESIENAVQQGRSVVRSMLGYSREAGDQPRSYAAGDVVADTVALLSKQFLGGIVLTLDVDRATPQVWGAPSRLEQILLNLIVNAAEAMNGHGELIIQARAGNHLPGEPLVLRPRPAEQYVEVSVKDSGPGIGVEILPRIFEPFFTTKIVGTSAGTGLGLSTVYTIAQQDGLGLAVETTPGEGTTFRVWIPVVMIQNLKSEVGSGLESPIAAGGCKIQNQGAEL
jgi:signal transduction histidine kinase